MKSNQKRIYFTLLMSMAVFACSESTQKSTESSIGATVYQSTCIACHSNGINGAPIFGNSKMWASRVSKGEAQLINNAINGYSLMPAKGGATSLTDDEVSAAVKYMLSAIE